MSTNVDKEYKLVYILLWSLSAVCLISGTWTDTINNSPKMHITTLILILRLLQDGLELKGLSWSFIIRIFVLLNSYLWFKQPCVIRWWIMFCIAITFFHSRCNKFIFVANYLYFLSDMRMQIDALMNDTCRVKRSEIPLETIQYFSHL